MTAPSWGGRYVVAVERVDWWALRHALPRPTLPLHLIERAPAMCETVQVLPLLVMGTAMLDFWGEESTCPACRTAIAAAEAARPAESSDDSGGTGGGSGGAARGG
ncbi:hypothetical protein [Actinomadura violacea]|uniref:Uncharacterized protein n=1 Tax=Actinomadura violacea TaxID=2819934 RepID=A0ABS3RZG0_9ACTN|nr:hypothetical protein [Actinomadura violacea]MBO2461678.1 hypothetical protein [Actinomadura violacea]